MGDIEKCYRRIRAEAELKYSVHLTQGMTLEQCREYIRKEEVKIGITDARYSYGDVIPEVVH